MDTCPARAVRLGDGRELGTGTSENRGKDGEKWWFNGGFMVVLWDVEWDLPSGNFRIAVQNHHF